MNVKEKQFQSICKSVEGILNTCENEKAIKVLVQSFSPRIIQFLRKENYLLTRFEKQSGYGHPSGYVIYNEAKSGSFEKITREYIKWSKSVNDKYYTSAKDKAEFPLTPSGCCVGHPYDPDWSADLCNEIDAYSRQQWGLMYEKLNEAQQLEAVDAIIEEPKPKKGKPSTDEILALIREVRTTTEKKEEVTSKLFLNEREHEDLTGKNFELITELKLAKADMRKIFPRTDGDQTFRFPNGDVFNIHFSTLTVKKINIIEL